MGKTLSAIVAIALNGAIGKNGDLLCHLSADLKHFKALTMGHSIVMGRRTFDSLPKGALPGRQNIVITRNSAFSAPGVTVARSVDDALQKAEMPGEVMIIGGAQIYRETLPLVSKIHLTRVEASFADADAFFPEINPEEWTAGEEERHEADERNPFPYTFLTLTRKNK